MLNPILEQARTQSGTQAILNNLQPFRNMLNTIRNSRNPQAMLQNMMMQNPQLKQAMDWIQQNGGNTESAFYALAKQRGYDPNAVLNALKQL